MILYTVGFAFDTKKEKVVLIRKNRPAWQAGKLNGVGGKVENDETSLDAMVREFYEETGVKSNPVDWHEYCVMSSSTFRVAVFRMFSDEIYNAKSMTDEEVVIQDVELNHLGQIGISNLPWLIGAALDADAHKFQMNVFYAHHVDGDKKDYEDVGC